MVVSAVEKGEENSKCEALGRGRFKQDVGKAPLRCCVNMVMKEVRESAVSVVFNENNIVRHRRQQLQEL